MEALLSVCLGLGLAAACGFRIFVPFLVMSVAARAGHLDLSPGFLWVASDAALWTLAAATALEVGAYFVPWLDNLLDSMAAPTAVVAGILAGAATMVQDTSPLVGWTLAVIGGGGLAAVIQTGTTVLRGASTMLTAGFGNPVVSTAEAGGAVGLSALAILLPMLALFLVLTLVLVVGARTARALAPARVGGASPLRIGGAT
jgi:hypothetical protein